MSQPRLARGAELSPEPGAARFRFQWSGATYAVFVAESESAVAITARVWPVSSLPRSLRFARVRKPGLDQARRVSACGAEPSRDDRVPHAVKAKSLDIPTNHGHRGEPGHVDGR